jgi:hypothetical protein
VMRCSISKVEPSCRR